MKPKDIELIKEKWRETYRQAWKREPPEIEYSNGWFLIQKAKYRKEAGH